MEELSFNDEVWFRVVQIVQEAMLTGQDCSTLLKEIRVSKSDVGDLVLTNAYKLAVKERHAQLLALAAKSGKQSVVTE
jgi:hypothetical protein